MRLRSDVLDLLRTDAARFRERVEPTLAAVDAEPVAATLTGGPEAVGDHEGVETGDLATHERDLVWRAAVLDRAPVGVTVCGPAYADTPILYANRRFRELTGYAMDRLRGANPRLLQGPDTDPEPVADLAEALSTWQSVTVELTNYRRDGEAFRNRVSIAPVTDTAGTVTNWVGVQRPVE